ncbi:hypothetical protein B7C51_09180 [Paenibacillus larvae subsp. pulvifaciens]|uniref:LiaF transmembrane domain-containing protein n=1 Tax=Paenibacillus larvae subsp. pulvifaciens TaxID=1477 RepID=A0A1V0URQ2_9BACL|nr:hypothetical protein [Paenibacillus larvae]ARF67963.1 hypothetical protein B7C51_09180 [Paenibacillus larvae subsp. pulvifaciens]
MKKNSGMALVLILFGVWMLLSKLGIHLSPIMGYLVPIAMVITGYIGIKNGSVMGWIVALLGVFVLLGKLTTIFIIIFAVVLIGIGFSMLKKPSNPY